MRNVIRSLRLAPLAVVVLLVASARSADAQLAIIPHAAAMDFNTAARALRDSIVSAARAHVGKPYRRGGRSPRSGFDCSGFVQYVLSAFDRNVPRTAAQQASFGFAVDGDTSRLRPGDLVTFGTGRRISHVGIYIGEGRFVHASSVAGRVIVSRMDRRAERVKPWRGARRLFAVTDDVAPTATAAQ